MDPIEELLTRRVDKILPAKEGLKQLVLNKKIRLYQGFDPTGGRLHLGHTIGLRKLMDFANQGHEVIFLFGTGTVLVGDPSLRDTARKLITQAEIDENIKGWKDQVSPLVDFDKVQIRQNGDWLVPLTLKDIVNIASHISAVQLFKRESFQRRIEHGDTVWYHETMYPLLQGYDSVAMDVDLEIGGTDQEFNMLVGRELQRKMNNREKFVLTVPMIVGIDGFPMSKTRGNAVWLNDTAQDMYLKLMQLPDAQIIPYMELVTNISKPEIEQTQTELSQGINPLEAKKKLAHAVVSQLHSEAAAQEAAEFFKKTVQNKELPDEMPAVSLKAGANTLLKLCQLAGVGESNADIRRTIEQGGVEVNGQKITDFNQTLDLKPGDVLRFGKRRYIKIQIEE